MLLGVLFVNTGHSYALNFFRQVDIGFGAALEIRLRLRDPAARVFMRGMGDTYTVLVENPLEERKIKTMDVGKYR